MYFCLHSFLFPDVLLYHTNYFLYLTTSCVIRFFPFYNDSNNRSITPFSYSFFYSSSRLFSSFFYFSLFDIILSKHLILFHIIFSCYSSFLVRPFRCLLIYFFHSFVSHGSLASFYAFLSSIPLILSRRFSFSFLSPTCLSPFPSCLPRQLPTHRCPACW